MTFGDTDIGEKIDTWESPNAYEALCEISKSGGIMPWLPLRYCCDYDSKRYAIPKPLPKTTITKLEKLSKEAKTKQHDNGKKSTRKRITKLPLAKKKEIMKFIQTKLAGAKMTSKPIKTTRQSAAPTRQVKIGRDKATGKLHIDK